MPVLTSVIASRRPGNRRKARTAPIPTPMTRLTSVAIPRRRSNEGRSNRRIVVVHEEPRRVLEALPDQFTSPPPSSVVSAPRPPVAAVPSSSCWQSVLRRCPRRTRPPPERARLASADESVGSGLPAPGRTAPAGIVLAEGPICAWMSGPQHMLRTCARRRRLPSGASPGDDDHVIHVQQRRVTLEEDIEVDVLLLGEVVPRSEIV